MSSQCYLTGCLTAHDALSSSIPMVTWPLEHVRGRYTYAMYHQMGLSDVVVHSLEEYVVLVLRLLTNETFHTEQTNKIHDAYYYRFNRNKDVAAEWMLTIRTLLL